VGAARWIRCGLFQLHAPDMLKAWERCFGFMDLLLNDETEYSSTEFKGVQCRGEEVKSKDFISCNFVKCSFTEAVFRTCKFRDCTFKACDLSLSDLKGCTLLNTRFDDSQLIGINWTDTNWGKNKFLRPADFYHCVINHSTFTGLDLKKIHIHECIARDVDFTEANLTGADCVQTDFTGSRFLHTNLTEADFTGAVNYSIAASQNTLKKTKFSLPEAMSLLYSLDIILTE
jgi:fluoroquinolone resistance protein